MTDPTGRSFLSYSRSRRGEAETLLAAQHDVGIPTWQDLRDLDEAPTADELERVLLAEETADAVLWLTPEVAGSSMIRRIEAPLALDRARRDDAFFVVPVAAGGLSYEAAAGVLDPRSTLEDLRGWNLRRVEADPLGPPEAAAIARTVLRRRIVQIDRRLPAGAPLALRLHTRAAPAFVAGVALALDWTGRFDGREARPGAWEAHLLPALREVTAAVAEKAPGRSVVASGLASIAAATALGAAFLAPRGLAIAWEQALEGGPSELWSLAPSGLPGEPSGFTLETVNDQVGGRDLAVLVSVADAVEPAFAAARGDLPALRAILRVAKPGGPRHRLAAAQATALALEVRDAIRAARRRFRDVARLHLFLAVPAGLAMMIGQLLNTFGEVQTYEHLGNGSYRPAALLRPA
jgi:hypothetical protein